MAVRALLAFRVAATPPAGRMQDGRGLRMTGPAATSDAVAPVGRIATAAPASCSRTRSAREEPRFTSLAQTPRERRGGFVTANADSARGAAVHLARPDASGAARRLRHCERGQHAGSRG